MAITRKPVAATYGDHANRFAEFDLDRFKLALLVNGTDGNDALVDTNDNDTINALEGNDRITVRRGGSDQVNGGEGGDTLTIDYSFADSAVFDSGAPAENGTLGGFNGRYYVNSSLSVSYNSIERFVITTGEYDDTITTATGNDVVSTGDGDDLVDVGAGKDVADGGAGTDRFSADFLNDTRGVSIDLRLATNRGAFGTVRDFEYFGTIVGSDFDDTFISATGRGAQVFNLQDGDDTVLVVGGSSTTNGGRDLDTLILDYSGATAAVFDSGAPSINGTLGGFDGRYYVDSLRFANYSSIERFEITTGVGDYDDTITTATGDDVVNTGDGDDLVNVGEGVDTANGGAGTDRLSASFLNDDAAVTIDLRNAVNEGAFGTFRNFEYFGTITGSDFADTFISATGRGAQTFNLEDGNDTAAVVNGNSTTNGGRGLDTLVIDYSGATAAVFDSGAPSANGSQGGFDGRYYVDSIRFANYSSIERFDITTGNGDYDDIITTATGDDVVNTGDGDDLVNVGRGTDTANGGAGVDRLSADFSDDTRKVDIDLNDAVNSGSFGVFRNFEYFGTITGSRFNDSFISAAGRGAQTFNTGNGNDLVKVVNGGATINGGAGSDTLVVDYSASSAAVFNSGAPSANGTLGGFDGRYYATNERFATYSSIETFDITGSRFTDTITTASGNDRLVMTAGGDLFNSGAGTDTIVLTDNFTAADRVRIADFSTSDILAVGATDFGGGLTAGALDADAFVAGTAAQDTQDRFIFDRGTGNLFYDVDGTGAAQSLLIATFGAGVTITSADILVI